MPCWHPCHQHVNGRLLPMWAVQIFGSLKGLPLFIISVLMSKLTHTQSQGLPWAFLLRSPLSHLWDSLKYLYCGTPECGKFKREGWICNTEVSGYVYVCVHTVLCIICLCVYMCVHMLRVCVLAYFPCLVLYPLCNHRGRAALTFLIAIILRGQKLVNQVLLLAFSMTSSCVQLLLPLLSQQKICSLKWNLRYHLIVLYDVCSKH